LRRCADQVVARATDKLAVRRVGELKNEIPIEKRQRCVNPVDHGVNQIALFGRDETRDIAKGALAGGCDGTRRRLVRLSRLVALDAVD